MTATTNEIVITKAQPGDEPQLLELVHAAYRRAKGVSSWTNEDKLVKGIRTTTEELTEVLTSSDKAILKAKVNGQLCGCVQVDDTGEGQGYIGLLSVDPDVQSKGLGKRLLQAAEDYARSEFAATGAIMWILEGRSELLDWYKRSGYQETGETEPFPGPESGAIALVENLRFMVIKKDF